MMSCLLISNSEGSALIVLLYPRLHSLLYKLNNYILVPTGLPYTCPFNFGRQPMTS